ncbi:histidine kinase N-terminal 7TM domain-containing protein [Pseudaeromonas sp. ZJS20]|uniref:histidine kinase N-terminal 7TM domain-containing protein n=1 Tax=Pseudaeromonas aegiceratis TaxID=3153928 RepID=UPI00390C4D0B
MMPSHPFSLLSWLLFLSAGLTLGLALFASRQRHYPVAHWFTWLTLAMSVYSLGYGMELATGTLTQLKFWINIQFIGAVFIPALLLLMSYAYQYHRHPPLTYRLLLLGLGGLNLAVQLGNDYHRLNLADIQFDVVDGLTLSRLTFGPWYYVLMLYAHLAVLVSLLVFYRSWRRAPRFHSHQALVLLCGAALPWLGYLVSLASLTNQLRLDWCVLSFSVSGLCFGYGLFRYRFTHLPPIGREQVFDEISEAVVVLDSQGRLLDFNRQAVQLYPVLSRDLIGRTAEPLLKELLPLLQQEGQARLSLSRQGRQYEVRCHRIRQDGPHTVGYALLMHDVTDRHQLLLQLRQQAEVDELTGVNNRRKILGLLEEAIAQLWQGGHHQPLSLILFDLDFFKQLNDSQGHQLGDQMLKRLASLVQETLMPGEQLGRYGGDEFLLLLPGKTTKEALALACQINQLIQQQLTMSLSLGIAGYQLQDSAHSLIQRADLALYQAKARGRGQACQQADTGLLEDEGR